MDEQELKEILSAIEKAGWRPELCDTPVPVSYHAVKCGLPAEMGEDWIDDYILLPKAVVGTHPYVLMPVLGDSMIDRLKNARFSVDEPMQIGWEEGAGRVFADRVVFALLTINRSASFERMQLFERAYEKLIQMKKEAE